MKLPDAVRQGKPGPHELTTPRQNQFSNQNVRAMLTIPAGATGRLPLILFFHGMSPKQTETFKTPPAEITRLSNETKAVLLSVQNLWGIHEGGDTASALLATADAAVDFIDALVQADIVNPEAIYATGFSAGGFAALSLAVYRPDLIRAFADFKGNFYPDVVEIFMDGARSMRDYYKIADDKRQLSGVGAYLCVGGPSDAPRVIQQAPQAKGFLDSQGVKVRYDSFPAEGHALTRANVDAFWAYVKTLP